MLDSIFIGMSGLMGYSRGLRVIANNTANINTPGFKGAPDQQHVSAARTTCIGQGAA